MAKKSEEAKVEEEKHAEEEEKDKDAGDMEVDQDAIDSSDDEGEKKDELALISTSLVRDALTGSKEL